MADLNNPNPSGEKMPNTTPESTGDNGTVAFNLTDQTAAAPSSADEQAVTASNQPEEAGSTKESQTDSLEIPDLDTAEASDMATPDNKPASFSKRMKVLILALVGVFLLASAIIVFLLGGTDLFRGTLTVDTNVARDLITQYASFELDSEQPITDISRTYDATLALQNYPANEIVPYSIIFSTAECYVAKNNAPQALECPYGVIDQGSIQLDEQGVGSKTVAVDFSEFAQSFPINNETEFKLIAEVSYKALQLDIADEQTLELVPNTETNDEITGQDPDEIIPTDDKDGEIVLQQISPEAFSGGKISQFIPTEETDPEPASDEVEPLFSLSQLNSISQLAAPALITIDIEKLTEYFDANCPDQKEISDISLNYIDLLIEQYGLIVTTGNINELPTDVKQAIEMLFVEELSQLVSADGQINMNLFTELLRLKHSEYLDTCNNLTAKLKTNLLQKLANITPVALAQEDVRPATEFAIDRTHERFVLMLPVTFRLSSGGIQSIQNQLPDLKGATADLELVRIDENLNPDESIYLFNEAYDAEPPVELEPGELAQIKFDQKLDLPNQARARFDLCINDKNNLLANTEDYEYVISDDLANQLVLPPAETAEEHLCFVKGEIYRLNVEDTASSWARPINGLVRNGIEHKTGTPYPLTASVNQALERLPLGEYEVELTIYDIQYLEPLTQELKFYDEGLHVTASDTFLIKGETPATETVKLNASPITLNEKPDSDFSTGNLEPLTLTLEGASFTEDYNFLIGNPLDTDFLFTNIETQRLVPLTPLAVTRVNDQQIKVDLKAANHDVINNQKVFVRLRPAASTENTIIQAEETITLNFGEPKGSEPDINNSSLTVEIDRERLTNDPDEPQNNGPITTNYQLNLIFPEISSATVSLCVFENDDNAVVPKFCLQDEENVNFANLPADSPYTYIAAEDDSLPLLERQINLSDFAQLPDGDYKVGLVAQDIVYGDNQTYAGPLTAENEPVFKVERLAVSFDEPDEPQNPVEQDPAIELVVSPRSINVNSPGQAIYDFRVSKPNAQEALIDLFLFEDDIEDPIVFIQSNKTVDLDNTASYSTSDPDNISTNSVSQRRIFGTTTNTSTGNTLTPGDYNVALVVKRVDSQDLETPLVDTAEVQISAVVAVTPQQPEDNEPVTTTPQTPVVTAPTSPTITPGEREQIAQLPSADDSQPTTPSQPDAQASIVSAPGVAGNTGPGMLIYPFFAGGSYLLARRRRKQK